MAKANVAGLRRPARKMVTKTYTDPEQPGVEITLTLRALDWADSALTLGAANELLEMFGESGLPAAGEVIPLTLELAQMLCGLEVAQLSAPEEERYSAEELGTIMVTMPTAWRAILADVNTLAPANPKADLKNSSAADATTTSAPSSAASKNTRRSRKNRAATST